MGGWRIGIVVSVVVVLAIPLVGMLRRGPREVTISGPAGSITIKGDVIQRMRESETEPPVVTMAQYEQVHTGMTVAEVQAIIGNPGKMTSESQMPGFMGRPGTVLQFYQWNNPQFMSYMSASFENGKLSSKDMSNLK